MTEFQASHILLQDFLVMTRIHGSLRYAKLLKTTTVFGECRFFVKCCVSFTPDVSRPLSSSGFLQFSAHFFYGKSEMLFWFAEIFTLQLPTEPFFHLFLMVGLYMLRLVRSAGA